MAFFSSDSAKYLCSCSQCDQMVILGTLPLMVNHDHFVDPHPPSLTMCYMNDPLVKGHQIFTWNNNFEIPYNPQNNAVLYEIYSNENPRYNRGRTILGIIRMNHAYKSDFFLGGNWNTITYMIKFNFLNDLNF